MKKRNLNALLAAGCLTFLAPMGANAEDIEINNGNFIGEGNEKTYTLDGDKTFSTIQVGDENNYSYKINTQSNALTKGDPATVTINYDAKLILSDAVKNITLGVTTANGTNTLEFNSNGTDLSQNGNLTIDSTNFASSPSASQSLTLKSTLKNSTNNKGKITVTTANLDGISGDNKTKTLALQGDGDIEVQTLNVSNSNNVLSNAGNGNRTISTATISNNAELELSGDKQLTLSNLVMSGDNATITNNGIDNNTISNATLNDGKNLTLAGTKQLTLADVKIGSGDSASTATISTNPDTKITKLTFNNDDDRLILSQGSVTINSEDANSKLGNLTVDNATLTLADNNNNVHVNNLTVKGDNVTLVNVDGKTANKNYNTLTFVNNNNLKLQNSKIANNIDVEAGQTKTVEAINSDGTQLSEVGNIGLGDSATLNLSAHTVAQEIQSVTDTTLTTGNISLRGNNNVNINHVDESYDLKIETGEITATGTNNVITNNSHFNTTDSGLGTQINKLNVGTNDSGNITSGNLTVYSPKATRINGANVVGNADSTSTLTLDTDKGGTPGSKITVTDNITLNGYSNLETRGSKEISFATNSGVIVTGTNNTITNGNASTNYNFIDVLAVPVLQSSDFGYASYTVSPSELNITSNSDSTIGDFNVAASNATITMPAQVNVTNLNLTSAPVDTINHSSGISSLLPQATSGANTIFTVATSSGTFKATNTNTSGNADNSTVIIVNENSNSDFGNMTLGGNTRLNKVQYRGSGDSAVHNYSSMTLGYGTTQLNDSDIKDGTTVESKADAIVKLSTKRDDTSTIGNIILAAGQAADQAADPSTSTAEDKTTLTINANSKDLAISGITLSGEGELITESKNDLGTAANHKVNITTITATGDNNTVTSGTAEPLHTLIVGKTDKSEAGELFISNNFDQATITGTSNKNSVLHVNSTDNQTLTGKYVTLNNGMLDLSGAGKIELTGSGAGDDADVGVFVTENTKNNVIYNADTRGEGDTNLGKIVVNDNAILATHNLYVDRDFSDVTLKSNAKLVDAGSQLSDIIVNVNNDNPKYTELTQGTFQNVSMSTAAIGEKQAADVNLTFDTMDADSSWTQASSKTTSMTGDDTHTATLNINSNYDGTEGLGSVTLNGISASGKTRVDVKGGSANLGNITVNQNADMNITNEANGSTTFNASLTKGTSEGTNTKLTINNANTDSSKFNGTVSMNGNATVTNTSTVDTTIGTLNVTDKVANLIDNSGNTHKLTLTNVNGNSLADSALSTKGNVTIGTLTSMYGKNLEVNTTTNDDTLNINTIGRNSDSEAINTTLNAVTGTTIDNTGADATATGLATGDTLALKGEGTIKLKGINVTSAGAGATLTNDGTGTRNYGTIALDNGVLNLENVNLKNSGANSLIFTGDNNAINAKNSQFGNLTLSDNNKLAISDTADGTVKFDSVTIDNQTTAIANINLQNEASTLGDVTVNSIGSQGSTQYNFLHTVNDSIDTIRADEIKFNGDPVEKVWNIDIKAEYNGESATSTVKNILADKIIANSIVDKNDNPTKINVAIDSGSVESDDVVNPSAHGYFVKYVKLADIDDNILKTISRTEGSETVTVIYNKYITKNFDGETVNQYYSYVNREDTPTEFSNNQYDTNTIRITNYDLGSDTLVDYLTRQGTRKYTTSDGIQYGHVDGQNQYITALPNLGVATSNNLVNQFDYNSISQIVGYSTNRADDSIQLFTVDSSADNTSRTLNINGTSLNYGQTDNIKRNDERFGANTGKGGALHIKSNDQEVGAKSAVVNLSPFKDTTIDDGLDYKELRVPDSEKAKYSDIIDYFNNTSIEGKIDQNNRGSYYIVQDSEDIYKGKFYKDADMSYNRATVGGGAVYNEGANSKLNISPTVSKDGVRFANNIAGFGYETITDLENPSTYRYYENANGGAILNTSGAQILGDRNATVTFEHNKATGNGGAIFNDAVLNNADQAAIKLAGNTNFIRNIAMQPSLEDITKSVNPTLYYTSASDETPTKITAETYDKSNNNVNGGAIYNQNGGTISLGSVAADAVYDEDGNLITSAMDATMTRFINNEAFGNGGATASVNNDLEVYGNSEFIANTAVGGTQVADYTKDQLTYVGEQLNVGDKVINPFGKNAIVTAIDDVNNKVTVEEVSNGNGGAISAVAGSTVTLNEGQHNFYNNKAGGNGGAIYVKGVPSNTSGEDVVPAKTSVVHITANATSTIEGNRSNATFLNNVPTDEEGNPLPGYTKDSDCGHVVYTNDVTDEKGKTIHYAGEHVTEDGDDVAIYLDGDAHLQLDTVGAGEFQINDRIASNGTNNTIQQGSVNEDGEITATSNVHYNNDMGDFNGTFNLQAGEAHFNTPGITTFGRENRRADYILNGGTTFDVVNREVHPIYANSLDLSGTSKANPLHMMTDLKFETSSMDHFNIVNNPEETLTGFIEVTPTNKGVADKGTTNDSLFFPIVTYDKNEQNKDVYDKDLNANIDVTSTVKTLTSPGSLYRYDVLGQQNGLLLKRVFDPSPLAPQVAVNARLAGQLDLFNDVLHRVDEIAENRYFHKVERNNLYAKDPNVIDDRIFHIDEGYTPYVNQEDGGCTWLKANGTIENIAPSGQDGYKNRAWNAFIGYETPVATMKNGWDLINTVFGGYQGSYQDFDNVENWQNGGSGGYMANLYHNNFFAGGVVMMGGTNVDVKDSGLLNRNMNFGLFDIGASTRIGYNVGMGKHWLFQPMVTASYIYITGINRHNESGEDVHLDGTNTIHIAPGFKIVGNYRGWKPYVLFDYTWPIIAKTAGNVNNVDLPDVGLRSYVEYGVGLRKDMGERFTGHVEAVMRHGGRKGVSFQGGLVFKF